VIENFLWIEMVKKQWCEGWTVENMHKHCRIFEKQYLEFRKKKPFFPLMIQNFRKVKILIKF